MASFSRALPAGERCERPSKAERSTSGVQPGRLAHGPLEKFGIPRALRGFLDGVMTAGSRCRRPTRQLAPRKAKGGARPPLRDPTARQLVHVEPEAGADLVLVEVADLDCELTSGFRLTSDPPMWRKR